MLLSRYHNIDFILSLDLSQFIELLVKAYEKRDKDQAFQMWLTRYPHMTEENFVPFETYYQSLKVPKDKRSAEDIVQSVIENYEKYTWQ